MSSSYTDGLGHVGLGLVLFYVCCVFVTGVSLFVIVILCFCIIWLFFGCQYQRNRLPGKTRLRNDLLCVEWDVKLTHTIVSDRIVKR